MRFDGIMQSLMHGLFLIGNQGSVNEKWTNRRNCKMCMIKIKLKKEIKQEGIKEKNQFAHFKKNTSLYWAGFSSSYHLFSVLYFIFSTTWDSLGILYSPHSLSPLRNQSKPVLFFPLRTHVLLQTNNADEITRLCMSTHKCSQRFYWVKPLGARAETPFYYWGEQ